MSVSKISIISNAFNLLGRDSVNAPLTNKVSQAASALYDTLYRSSLGSHPWLFAMKVEYELSRLSLDPASNRFQFAYQKPSDLLNLYRVSPNVPIALYGDKIYSNYKGLKVDYTHQVDEDKLPPFYVEALEYGIAAKCGVLVTESEKASQMYFQIYEARTQSAKYLDSQGQTNPYLSSQPMIEAFLGDSSYFGPYGQG